MGWWTLIAAVSTGAAAAVAIGYISYSIYEAYKREELHSHSRRTNDDRKKSNDFESYEEIKRKVRDLDLRLRNVGERVYRNEKQSIMEKSTPVSDHETQTEDSDRPGLIVPDDKQRKLNDDDIESLSSSATFDETESTCDSLASTETITSDMDEDQFAHSIPTYWEMSCIERNSSNCRGCYEAYVSTITIPCYHLYLCSECAPMLMQYYKRCCWCQKPITDYLSIENK